MRGRIAVFDQGFCIKKGLHRGGIYVACRRIDGGVPQRHKLVGGIALRDGEHHRLLRPRKPHRLMKGAPVYFCFRNALPFAKDACKAAAVKQCSCGGIGDFVKIQSPVQRIPKHRPAASPRAIVQDTIHREMLLAGRARMEIIHPHGVTGKSLLKINRHLRPCLCNCHEHQQH